MRTVIATLILLAPASALACGMRMPEHVNLADAFEIVDDAEPVVDAPPAEEPGDQAVKAPEPTVEAPADPQT